MVESAALEPLALDVVRDPISDLGGRLDRYAGHLSDRLSDFGSSAADPRGPSLLRSLSNRWSMPGAGAGLIEVFDGSDFSGLVRHWSAREGYGGAEYGAQSPFVVPVDPIEHVEGISGAHLRRTPDRRRALRPVGLRSQRPSQRPRAIEKWRPLSAKRTPNAADGRAASTRFTAYPAAMGQAGAIDATLLRFPTAQAEIADGLDRAVVTDRGSSSIAWAPTASRTPAVQAAERLSADVAARLAPAPAADLGAWLVPASSPESDDALVQRMPRARLARPRLDARVPIAAFVPRIGRAAIDETSSPAAPWPADGIPGTLIEARRQEPTADANIEGRAPTAIDARRPTIDRGASANAPKQTVDALSAQIIERAAVRSENRPLAALSRSSQPPAGAVMAGATEPRTTSPWQLPSTPAPGGALFVPAALARLAAQVGETARPSEAPRADWPWERADPMPATSFMIADQAADGVLVQPAQARVTEAAPAAESGDDGRTRPATDRSMSSEALARPPDATLRATVQPPSAPSQRRAANQPVARTAQQAATRIAARVEARLARVLAASATRTSPVTLSNLLTHARAGASDSVWQAQIAADPALAQVLGQVDRLTPRTSMAAPLLASGSTGRSPSGMSRQPSTGAHRTRLEDGLSVLSGAPVSATLRSPSWSQMSPIARAMLGAAGFGPEADRQPGPAFSFGERLAAVAADLSSRHGLSTESSVAGGLDAAWFSEPTGTLVLPMTADPSHDQAGLSAARGADSPGLTARSQGATRTTSPVATDDRGAAAYFPPSAPSASRTLVGLPAALQAALRGAQRRGPAARLRPVPRLTRVDAPIAPEAMAMLTQVQTTPPAIVDILARAERLLAGGQAAAISALAQSADMPSLITLARLAEAPDALAALSDVKRAPGILRALARLTATTDSPAAADGVPLRAFRRLEQADGPPLDTLESLDAALVEIAGNASAVADDATGASRRREAGQHSPSRPAPAGLAESLKTLTNALPAALRAALAATKTPASSLGRPSRPTKGATRLSQARSQTVRQTRNRALTSASARPDGFTVGAIGQVARRAADWAQLAEAAAPRGFEALAIQAGDSAQSPIAGRVLAPRTMVADGLTRTWVTQQGQPSETGVVGASATRSAAVERTRAAPIGLSGRRSAAFAHTLDGLGEAPASQERRSIWQTPDAWTFIASTVGVEGEAGSAARTQFAPRTTSAARHQEAMSLISRDVTAPGVAGRGVAGRGVAGRGVAGRGVAGRGVAGPGARGPGATRKAANERTAMGVPGGKLRWPQATFSWVQAAAAEAVPAIGDASLPARGQAISSAAQRSAFAPKAMAGIASLRSLAVSDRILVQSLSGLGVFGSPASPHNSADPLSPMGATPRMALELALPGSTESSTSNAERFADETFARQARISAVDAPSPRSADAPEFNVDWVQPVKAVSDESAQLAPRLRSPSNISRALDVWVDAVKAEAVRSPSAARHALGSVGQLIAQFSTPAVSNTRVRPSNVLRGSLFGGRSASPVTLEAPQDGDARPALIRPGEHAARQALRKGNDVVQASQATTTEEARHKNSEQTDELIPPEEVERLAAEVIDRIKRELEFDAARMGEDGWD